MLLTTDMTDGSKVPYFLWDEPLTLDELRRHLGRRLGFWDFLIAEWRSLGLIS